MWQHCKFIKLHMLNSSHCKKIFLEKRREFINICKLYTIMQKEVIHIDGSLLEGGGQIIRNALSFSCLTQTPIKITNIRAGRKKPGLMEQHLKGLELVQQITNAKVSGAELGSTTVEFRPNLIKGGKYRSIVRTAGSISLLLQVSLPCVFFATQETELYLQGGTNAEMAPQIDYMTEVFRPNLEKFGATFDFDLIKRGYFPRGGGEVSVIVKPVKELNSVDLTDFGSVNSVYGWSYVAGDNPIAGAHAMADCAENVLRKDCKNVNIERYKESRDIAPIGSCSGIILIAETDTGCIVGGSALKGRGGSLEEPGERAATELLASLKSKACVDSHCQDQLILLMALAEGKSRVRTGEITMHTKTAIYVAELMTNAKFNIIENNDHSIIECDGIGYKNNISQ